MRVIWKYNKRNKKASKHAFFFDSNGSAICGTILTWFDTGDFRNDRAGLASRKPCKRCLEFTQ